jgi:hypothetical protein
VHFRSITKQKGKYGESLSGALLTKRGSTGVHCLALPSMHYEPLKAAGFRMGIALDSISMSNNDLTVSIKKEICVL